MEVLNPEKDRDLGRTVPPFGKKLGRGITLVDNSMTGSMTSRRGTKDAARTAEGGGAVALGGSILKEIGTGSVEFAKS